MSTQEKKRQGYIHELIQTEERYVDDLQIVLEVIDTRPCFVIYRCEALKSDSSHKLVDFRLNKIKKGSQLHLDLPSMIRDLLDTFPQAQRLKSTLFI